MIIILICFVFSKKNIKTVTKQEGPKFFLAAPKMVSFSQLPAVKKGPMFGATRKFFGPSYFVTALVTKSGNTPP